ncbi:tetracycline resistance MFS efflux pump, partial [Xanthomonas oryzae pv. oryzae]
LFANVFALFIGSGAPLHLPGAPWLLAGVLLAAGWGMAWKRAGRGTGTAAATQG